MIRCHLSRLMGEKKVRVADVARATGLHRGTITLLYEETAVRIELDAMNRLCAYFGCRVEDIFEYIPDSVPDDEKTER